MHANLKPIRALAGLLLLLLCASAAVAASGDYFVYIGTYTKRTSKGIYLCRLDTTTGKLDVVGLAAETVNPSFVARHPSRPILYSIGEIAQHGDKPGGAVSASRFQTLRGAAPTSAAER